MLNNNYGNLSWALIHLDLWGKFRGDAELVQYARSKALQYLFEPVLDGTTTQRFRSPTTRSRPVIFRTVSPASRRCGEDLRRRAGGLDQGAALGQPLLESLVIPNPNDVTHNNGVNWSRAFGLWWIYQATNQETVRTNAIRLLMDHLAQPVHWDLQAPYDSATGWPSTRSG